MYKKAAEQEKMDVLILTNQQFLENISDVHLIIQIFYIPHSFAKTKYSVALVLPSHHL